MKKILISIIIAIFIYSPSNAKECYDDTLKENIERGRYLLTLSGKLFKTLAGERFDAMFWFKFSDLVICGGDGFIYEGETFYIYDIINIDDGETVSARLIN